MIDLIRYLQNFYKLKTLLIAPSNLGSINDTMLSIQALKKYSINFQWFINLHKDKETFKEITLPFYNDYFDRIRFI